MIHASAKLGAWKRLCTRTSAHQNSSCACFVSHDEPHTCNSFTYGPARSTVRLLQMVNRIINCKIRPFNVFGKCMQCRSLPCHRRLYRLLALNLPLMPGPLRPSSKCLVDVELVYIAMVRSCVLCITRYGGMRLKPVWSGRHDG